MRAMPPKRSASGRGRSECMEHGNKALAKLLIYIYNWLPSEKLYEITNKTNSCKQKTGQAAIELGLFHFKDSLSSLNDERSEIGAELA